MTLPVTDAPEEADATRAHLAAIVESSADAIICKTLDCIITRWNSAAEGLYGYGAAEAIGQSIGLIIPPDRTDELPALLARLHQGERIQHFETERVQKDGNRVAVSLSISPIRAADGTIVGAATVGRDITEQRRSDAALRGSEEQLRQAHKMEAIGVLAGGIAHDFNNLLTAIIGFSELVVDTLAKDDPRHAYVQQVLGAGEQAAVLTRELLAFSRKQVLQPEVLHLNSVVAEMEKLLRRVIGEDIDLVIVLASELRLVEADPGQLYQIIMNLVVNARDAIRDGGKLTIETANVELDATYVSQHPGTVPGGHVMLAISDTGHGMDAETQARIFEPFFTTKEVGKGTGLGLSTVYGIVKQSGGSIWVESEPGRGTTFKIYLPQVDIGSVAPELALLRAVCPQGTETVLLVEDEPAVRSLVSAVLTSLGYTVLEASHGGEALDAAQRHLGSLDLLLTDMVMPEMGGREVAQRLSAAHPGLKVLYMSGFPVEATSRQWTLATGAAFLQKPFTPLSLARKVRETLDDYVPQRPARSLNGTARPTAGGRPVIRSRAATRPTPESRLFLCDDHEMARAGLRAMLSSEPDLEIVGEAAEGREAVRLCQQLEPDLVLMDRLMPGLDGIAATREIKAQCPRIGVVIITGNPDPESLFDAIKAGAAGYLPKGVSRREVVTAVRRVLAGDSLIDGELAATLLRRLAQESTQRSAAPPIQLTERERDVLRLITQGGTNSEIARSLYFSVATVKAHVQHIIRKLGVSDRTQAAVHAIELGLLSPGGP